MSIDELTIRRINELYKKSKEKGLTDAEKAATRRVEFRIKTNSDKIVQQFQKAKEQN